MPNIEAGWDLYRSFLAVVRTGSLSAAARSLNLTQPTIGRHVARLQEILGSRVLFTRSPQGLLPTAAAQELRVHAETMEAAAAALRRAAASDPEEKGSTLRIAAAEVMGAEVLPAILSDFRFRHPTTVIELSVSNQVVDLLRRDADIAVRMAPPKQKALIAKRIGDVRLGFFAHRHYLEKFGQPQNVQELLGHSLIGFDRFAPYDRLQKSLPVKVHREMFSFRCDNDLAQLAAIRAGFGVGMCHERIARRDPDLVPLFARQVRVNLPVWVVMHADLKRSPAVRLMFDHLVSHLSRYTTRDA
jgi:DNA-binding transcriptional LysR family regulator